MNSATSFKIGTAPIQTPQLDLSTLDFVKDRNKYILKLWIDLSQIYPEDDPSAFDEKIQLVSDWLKGKIFPSSESLLHRRCLFLLHRTENLTSLKPYIEKDGRCVAYEFGGGQGLLYGENGILASNQQYYQDLFDPEKDIARPLTGGQFEIRSENSYDNVFESCWYQTSHKLRKICRYGSELSDSNIFRK